MCIRFQDSGSLQEAFFLIIREQIYVQSRERQREIKSELGIQKFTNGDANVQIDRKSQANINNMTRFELSVITYFR